MHFLVLWQVSVVERAVVPSRIGEAGFRTLRQVQGDGGLEIGVVGFISAGRRRPQGLHLRGVAPVMDSGSSPE